MQNANGWLVLHDRDILTITIHIPTIKEVIKHYVEEQGRSYLCQGENCTFCAEDIPRRVRYIVEITFHGETLKWEIGEMLCRLIRRLHAQNGIARATVIRSGKGKNTRYRIHNPNLRQS